MRKLALILLAVAAACGDDTTVKQPDAALPDENHPPTVGDFTLTTTEDTPITHPIVVSDPDGDHLTLTVSTPAHGTVTMTDTTVTYTPAANYNGTDSFTITAGDGTVSAMANVTVTIDPVNDAPVAVNDALAAAEDTAAIYTPAMVLGNDTDIDGDTLTVTSVSNPTHGTVVLGGNGITFTPAANFAGAASFDYVVSDGTATDTGTVTVTVSNTNDPPVAVDDAFSTPEDMRLVLTSAMITANDTDGDLQTLTVTAANVTSGGSVGTAVLAGGNLTVTPAPNQSGTITIAYTVSDGVATDTGNIVVTVTPVDDAPDAVDDGPIAMVEDTDKPITVATLTANDSDVDGPSPSITGTSNPSHVTATLAGGTITVHPDADYNGPAGFDYTYTAGTLSDTAHVSLTIAPVNDAPVANGDLRTVLFGVVNTIPFSALTANDTDVDGDTLTIVSVTNAMNCTATIVGTTIKVDATSTSAPLTSFDYTVSDGTATSSNTVTITVSTTPVCGDSIVSGTEDCDDGNATAGDGCSATCVHETGWTCSNQSAPSVCTPICGDGMKLGTEECDDNNLVDTDGCTSMCKLGRPCAVANFAQGDHFAVDPATGHCYVGFDDDMAKWADAETACLASGGYLATITSAAEQTAVTSAMNPAQNPWIGATDDANDTDDIFNWVTGETTAGFKHYAPNQPDDDASSGGNGECLHFVDAQGNWNDTNCDINTFVVGRVCEFAVASCGDGIVEAGEQCDDHNVADGDGCSATCQLAPLLVWSFTSNVSPVAPDAPNASLMTQTVIRGPGLGDSNTANVFNSTGWPQNTTIDTTMDYISINVVPATGKTLTLSKFSVGIQRSTSGPTTWVLRSSLDGFAADLAGPFTSPTAIATTSIDLAPASFANRTTGVEFRIYAFSATAAAGTFRIDNLSLLGGVQ